MDTDFSFDPSRHLYMVQGQAVPSVTQVLHAAGLSANYSSVAPEVLERKRIIGEYVHKATQYLDEGSLDLATIDPQIQPYLAAYQQFLNDSGFRSRLVEHRVVGNINGMLCGGTVDREGTMAGKLWIIDLKCIERLYPSFGLQTAGYELDPANLEPGLRLNLACRVVTKPTDDGKYLNVEKVLPLHKNANTGGNDDGPVPY